MNDPTNPDDPKHEAMPLTVLPNSGKAEALRKEMIPIPRGSFGDPTPRHTSPADLSTAQRVIEANVVEVLRTVYDPELPVNIYDLGLIYEILVDEENRVEIKMTLTAPGCPVAGSLPGQVETKVEGIPAVKSANVELVWDPPWDKTRMSEAAILDLGLA